MRRVSVLLLILTSILAGRTPEWERARELYQRTEYRQTLTILLQTPEKDAATLQLIGQSYFMLAEYKKATEALEAAVALDPNNASALHWLGRAYGRRAEMANPFSAPGFATKARQMFERSVALDPSNKEAAGDLLDYYLDAPGFLGGGMQKAEALAKVIARDRPGGRAIRAGADRGSSASNTIRPSSTSAARRGIGSAPGGPVCGSGEISGQARASSRKAKPCSIRRQRMAPDDPQDSVRARQHLRQRAKRNLDQARELLERYLRAPLTPDDPPREQAQRCSKRSET